MLETLATLLPAATLAPLAVALGLLIRHRYTRDAPCGHSGWLDLPSSGTQRGTVHERVQQGYRELAHQRDIAWREAKAWETDCAELRAQMAALERAHAAKVQMLEGLNQDRWEAVDALEREVAMARAVEQELRDALWDSRTRDA